MSREADGAHGLPEDFFLHRNSPQSRHDWRSFATGQRQPAGTSGNPQANAAVAGRLATHLQQSMPARLPQGGELGLRPTPCGEFVHEKTTEERFAPRWFRLFVGTAYVLALPFLVTAGRTR